MSSASIDPLQAILLLAGLWLVQRGWRGQPTWSAPSCGACRFDLRGLDQGSPPKCPECGADLAKPHGVHFGRWRRQPRSIVLGLMIMLAGAGWFAADATLRALGKSWRDFRSNASVIAELGRGGDPTRALTDLESRLRSQTLSEAEIDGVIHHVCAGLKQSGGGGPWVQAQGFTSLLAARDRLSSSQRAALAEAWLSGDPVVNMRSRIRQGSAARFSIQFSRRPPFNLVPDTAMLMSLREVRCADRVLTSPAQMGEDRPAMTASIRDPFSAAGHMPALNHKFHADLVPGTHDIHFEIDVGLAESEAGQFRMIEPPGQAEQWPATLHRRRMVVTVPLTVLPADQSPIDLIHDTSLAAQAHQSVKVRAVEVLRLGKSDRLRVAVRLADSTPVPIAAEVVVRIGEREYVVGSFHARDRGSAGAGSSPAIGDLPADSASATVILRPSREVAERDLDGDHILGDELVFTDVPVRRVEMPGRPKEPRAAQH